MKPALCLVFISGLCCFTQGSSDFHHIRLAKTYSDAKNYCREMFTDLATLSNSTDVTRLNVLVNNTVRRAWIGLEVGDEYRWHWSWPDQTLDFLNWKAGEPQNNDTDACAAMDQHGEWFESVCRTRRSFVCRGNGDGLRFVADAKSWRDAHQHCRDLSSELASIRSAEENEAVQNVSGSQSVWIGLFMDPWKWSDGSGSSFRFWKASQPNYLEGQNCTSAVFSDQGKWNDLRCTVKRSFICRGAEKSTMPSTNPTNTMDTIRDPPAANTTTAAPTASPSHGADVTTNVTDNEATTVSELTTPNTTDGVSVTLSLEPNTAATEMSPVTAEERPPSTTHGVPASTVWTTTQHSENSSGNLILVQENMTWVEAMRYCRVHYSDLVHITTEDMQEKVAEQAQRATSAHVWLGLRYTCSFNFWFWTSWSADCYMNWAPGQGPDGEYDCGVTGAIQATGRQQWVGLPETERLNFICTSCAG